MPHNRFYLDATMQEGASLTLEGEEAHHLARVMRNKIGDQIELVNGKNQFAIAQIRESTKKGVGLILLKVEEIKPPLHSTILCQALPRLNRLDTIVEKGCELGMDELWLFPGQLSEKKTISQTQLKRLEAISIAAMKQSGRFTVPKITLMPPLSKWERLPFPAYFGSTLPESPPFLTLYKEKSSLLFFIGPEAGFTPQELQQLSDLSVRGVSLHSHILRVDTAPLVALALIATVQ